MNGLLMFLLSSWISCAVSKVEIRYIGLEYTATYHHKLNLVCTVTAPDTFLGWKNPAGFVHNSSDYLYVKSGNSHQLTIHNVQMRDAGEWSCLSKQGTNDKFTMKITGSLAGTPIKDQKLVKDSPGLVSLNIVGYPKPIIKWSKDGGEISNATGRFSLAKNGSLLISAVEADDEGVYTVSARQPPVDIPVPQIKVTVLVSPTFTSVSVNENKTLGENLTIACAATGKPDPVITWKKGSDDITGTGRFVIDRNNGLTIKDVQKDDISSYTCIARNEAGSMEQTSRLSSILVTVVGTTVKTQNLVKGKLGIVEVNMVGYPKPDFKWDKNGIDVVEGVRIKVAKNGSLVISNVELGDAGTYGVLATQSNQQKAEKDIVVNVLAPPTFTTVGVKESRTVGGSIIFKCNATGSPMPTVTWKKETEDIKADNRLKITAEGLAITDIMESDVGDYSCVANSSVGTETQISTLTSVLVPPQISSLEDKQAEKGNVLKVNCSTTSGKPPAHVEWKKKNGADVPKKQQVKYSGGNVLSIDNVQPDDSGEYVCFAKNGAVDKAGKEIVRNQSMTVTVVYPPEFDPTSTQTVAEFNKVVEIKCVVNGNPAPNISLSFKDEDISGKLTRSMTQSVLSVNVNISQVDDFGVYICTASNELKGEVKHEVSVTVPLKKPEIKEIPGCDNVTISWVQDQTGPIKIKKFSLVLLDSTGNSVLQRQLVSADKSTFTLDRLEEQTAYKIRLEQLTNVPGTGRSTTMDFQTGKCTLTKINTVRFNDGMTKISWVEAQGDIKHYIFKYRPKGSGEWKNTTTEVIFIELPDLQRGKTYQFQVFVRNAEGSVLPLTDVTEKNIPKDTDEEQPKSTNRPETVSRKKGLSGGAIAAIVIVIILLVLIAVDVFCCFFNQCGVVHMCAAACAGRGKSKYNVDGSNPEEGTKLKEIEGQEPVA